MATENLHLGPIQFVPLIDHAPKIFGFPEFLAALALMVLVWTTATSSDARYRFRVQVSPLRLQMLTFCTVAVVGVLSLLTDLWRAQQWFVPEGSLITPSDWQALMGGALLLTFLLWAWQAFVRPSRFGKISPDRFARNVYRVLLRGSPAELAVIAEELCHSVPAIVKNATNELPRDRFAQALDSPTVPSLIEECANHLLLMMGDRRFCDVIATSGSILPVNVLSEMVRTDRLHVLVQTFGRNLITSAINNKSSFLYYETLDGYESGFLGYMKPVSTAMFSNFRLLSAVRTLLDPAYDFYKGWDADQWKALTRIVSQAQTAYLRDTACDYGILAHAISQMRNATHDLHNVDGVEDYYAARGPLERLRVIVHFLIDAIGELNAWMEAEERSGRTHSLHIRRPKDEKYDYLDSLAEAIFELLCNASKVRRPVTLCWDVQRNMSWAEFFDRPGRRVMEGKAGRIIQSRVFRLIFNSIAEMSRWTNYRGATLLGLCLNVTSIHYRRDKKQDALDRFSGVIWSWVRENYAAVYGREPSLAEACLPDGFSYDPQRKWILVKYRKRRDFKQRLRYFSVD